MALDNCVDIQFFPVSAGFVKFIIINESKAVTRVAPGHQKSLREDTDIPWLNNFDASHSKGQGPQVCEGKNLI